MGWQDRIKPAAYTAPVSGLRIEFAYEDVTKETDKHTTAFDFPDAPGTFVQVFGRSGRRLPLRLIFNGDDYDLLANQFDAMLDEDGVGILEHPMYGTFDVVPFGKIVRSDALKTRGNQAVFDVTFYETNGLLFPLKLESPAAALEAAIEDFSETAPVVFEAEVGTNTPSTIEKKTLRDRYAVVKNEAKSALAKIAAVDPTTANQFEAVDKEINDIIDVFIADPLALGFATTVLVELPARSGALIADRLAAYGDLLVSLTVDGTQFEPTSDAAAVNAFSSDDMLTSNILTAVAVAVLNAEFETKGNALSAADLLLDLFDGWVTWRDTNAGTLGVVDAGDLYRATLAATSRAVAFLLDQSFSLKQERAIVLVSPTTPIELEARYYRTVGENLDFLIRSNDFVGDELFEVPIGRTVVYYS